MTDDQLLTPADVARRCRVSTKTVLRAIHSGRLRASRLGSRGAYRVRPEDVLEWLDATATTGRGERPMSRRAEPLPLVASAPGPAGRLVVYEGMGAGR
jgi:excisionase family DNA binding protein